MRNVEQVPDKLTGKSTNHNKETNPEKSLPATNLAPFLTQHPAEKHRWKLQQASCAREKLLAF